MNDALHIGDYEDTPVYYVDFIKDNEIGVMKRTENVTDSNDSTKTDTVQKITYIVGTEDLSKGIVMIKKYLQKILYQSYGL